MNPVTGLRNPVRRGHGKHAARRPDGRAASRMVPRPTRICKALTISSSCWNTGPTCAPSDLLCADAKRQAWRAGSTEGSGRDTIVPMMLKRDCMVPILAIRAFQPSPPRPCALPAHFDGSLSQVLRVLQLSSSSAATPPQRSRKLLDTRLDGLLPCSEAGEAREAAEIDDPIIYRGMPLDTDFPSSRRMELRCSRAGI